LESPNSHDLRRSCTPFSVDWDSEQAVNQPPHAPKDIGTSILAQTHDGPPSSGVYFSANDAVLPWTIPFLNSFRAYNPLTRLIWIPFNDESDRLDRLATAYQFETFSDPSFPALEAIGRAMELGHASYGRFWFRRYAAFWGPLKRFLYLDARQVVLMNLDEFVSAPAVFGLDLVHYDTHLEQVYTSGPMRAAFLRDGLAHGFNSGRWASRRGLFTLSDFGILTEELLKLRDQLNPRNTDQAFINYCCDARRVRMAKINELLGDIISSGWARQTGRPYLDEHAVWRLWDHGGNDHKKRILLLHWAGQDLNTMDQPQIFRRFGGSRSTGLLLRRLTSRLKRSYNVRLAAKKLTGRPM
jgi:hypothetical protein